MDEGINTVVIAFDGTAASGKGTIARLIAEKLGYDYLDTGLMFRKVAYHTLSNNINFNKEVDLLNLTKKINFAELIDSSEIYSDDVSNLSSKIAILKSVRDELLKIQRKFAKNKKGVVVDGRDIGTVVFPNANFKFYFDACIEERAKRRYKQLQKMGKSIKLSSVLEYLKIRDERDKGRKSAPLVKAKDSFLIDTSRLNIDEILKIILNKIENN